MSTDVALAGFVFCADDWAAYDPADRAELMAAAAGGGNDADIAQSIRPWDSGRIDATPVSGRR